MSGFSEFAQNTIVHDAMSVEYHLTQAQVFDTRAEDERGALDDFTNPVAFAGGLRAFWRENAAWHRTMAGRVATNALHFARIHAS